MHHNHLIDKLIANDLDGDGPSLNVYFLTDAGVLGWVPPDLVPEGARVLTRAQFDHEQQVQAIQAADQMLLHRQQQWDEQLAAIVGPGVTAKVAAAILGPRPGG